MKFVTLFIALAGVFPLSLALRGNPGFARIFWTLFGMLPFLAAALPLFDIGLVSWAGSWIGFVYSLEVTVVDILALAALFAVPGGRIPWWCKLPLLLYLAAAVLSVFQADEPLAASFGAWQFARMFLVMVVVARACRHESRVALDILRGMALGMAMHLVAVLYQRFGLQVTQASGLFIHQNTLGMTTHLVLFPHLALLLYGFGRPRTLLLTVVGTVLVVIFTASRATVGLSALGMGVTYGVLALAGLTQRKVMLGLAAAVALAAIGPLAFSSFEKRFDAAPLTENAYDERAAFNRAALYILADHPAGIGFNHYVHVAKNFGYSERGGVAPSEVNRNNIVHNAYWLAAAETGYFGLIGFCIMLAVPLVCAFRSGWRERETAEGNLLLGLGVALLIVCLHSLYEWIIFAKEVQYLLFATMGMVFGLSLRIAARRRPRRSKGAMARTAPPASGAAIRALGRSS